MKFRKFFESIAESASKLTGKELSPDDPNAMVSALNDAAEASDEALDANSDAVEPSAKGVTTQAADAADAQLNAEVLNTIADNFGTMAEAIAALNTRFESVMTKDAYEARETELKAFIGKSKLGVVGKVAANNVDLIEDKPDAATDAEKAPLMMSLKSFATSSVRKAR